MAVKKKRTSEDRITKTATLEDFTVDYVETNCIGLDLGMTNGKGLPRGAAIAIYAMPGCGKTTICADAIFRIIRAHKEKGLDYKVAYFASEDCSQLLTSMGLKEYIDSGDLIYETGTTDSPLTFNMLENGYRDMLADKGKYAGVKLVIVDSITNIISETMLDKDIGAGDFGSNAKDRAQFYPKYLASCKSKGITSIFLSHIRVKQNATAYEDPKRPAITDTDMHNMDIIAKLSKIEDSKISDIRKIKVNTIFGQETLQDRYILKISTCFAKPTKNRYGRVCDCLLLIEPGKRVINTYTMRCLLEGWGYVKQNGAYYTISEELCNKFDLPENMRKNIRRKDINVFTRENLKELKEYLKLNDQYRINISEERDEDEDDGM